MLRRFLQAKIHQASVTETNLHYEGSLTVDRDLLDAAGLFPDEAVDVYNISNGHRFATYIIEGERGSRKIGVNGAAAHLASVGDRIIIAAYCELTPDEIESHQPVVLVLHDDNRIKRTAHP
ncbi:MAG: Aspartate 1-decarboxylase [Calditrichaeota bacterium]|nr:Aspartate 1-decarboxylase [Calditrichota bacterium]